MSFCMPYFNIVGHSMCMCGWQVNLQSEEYGKHLMGVEDLLQKHSIIESDIAIVGARVEAINTQAQTFVDADFPDVGGERHKIAE